MEEILQIKENLLGKKPIKRIYLNCNLENLNFNYYNLISGNYQNGLCPFFFRASKMLNRGLDKLELLRIVDAVARKSIDKELVIGSMESAIQKAALTKFGNDNNIEVIIDRESGDI